MLEVARTAESCSKVSEHSRNLRLNCAWGGCDSFVHVLEKGFDCYEKAFLSHRHSRMKCFLLWLDETLLGIQKNRKLFIRASVFPRGRGETLGRAE